MKKFLKSQWTIRIGTTLFGFILTVVYDVVKQKDIFSTILALSYQPCELVGAGAAD